MSAQRFPQQVAPHTTAGVGGVQPVADPVAAEIARHLAQLGHISGGVEIVAGRRSASDPNAIDLLVWTRHTYGSRDIPHTRKFFLVEQRAAQARYAARLAREHGDVYASIGTYVQTPNTYKGGALRWSREAPQPRRGFVLDDVRDLTTLRLPPSWATETSAGNYQVGYTCVEALSPATAQRLAEGAARLAGSDPSGSDPEQIIRLAGTRNTKVKNGPDGWRVRLVVSDGPQYTREELARAFLPGGVADLGGAGDDTPRARGSATSTAGRDVGTGDEAWRKAENRKALDEAAKPWRQHLEPGGLLLNKDGMPRRLKPDTPGYKILQAVRRGEMTYTSASGNWDASRERYHVMLSLMYHGYEDGQIVALAEHLANFGEAVKGTDAIRLDIHRLIFVLNAELGTKRRITPISFKGSEQAAPSEEAEPPHTPRASRGKGRPRVAVDAPQLLGFYLLRATEGVYTSTRRADAAALAISVPTLKRLDNALKDHGVITVDRQGNGRVVTVQGWLKNTAEVVSKPAEQGWIIRAVQPIVEPDGAGGASRENTPRPDTPLLQPLGGAMAGADVAAAGVAPQEAEPAPAPSAPVGDFLAAKATAKVDEAAILAALQQLYPDARAATWAEQRRGIDFAFTRRGGVGSTAELKSEERTSDTGNVFIETVRDTRHGHKGWIYSSEAEFLIHHTPLDGHFRVWRMADLRAALPALLARHPLKQGPINPWAAEPFHSEGIAVALDDLPTPLYVGQVAPRPSARPRLASLIGPAYDAVARQYADCATGELGRVTWQRVRAELEKGGHRFTDAQIKAELARERKRRAPKPWEAAAAEAAAVVDCDELRALAKKAASNYARIQREAAPAFVAEKIAKATEYNQLDASVSERKGEAPQPKNLAAVRASAEKTQRAARGKLNMARWRAEAYAAEVARRTPATAVETEDAQIAAQIAWAQQRAIDGPRERAEAVANHQRHERQDVAAVVEAARTPERPQEAPNVAQEGEDTTPARSAVPGGAGESTAANPYGPGYVPAMMERLKALQEQRQRLTVTA